MLKKLVRPFYRLLRRGVHRVRDFVLTSEHRYRKYLVSYCGVQIPPLRLPQQITGQGALKSEQEWHVALNEVRSLKLPRHPDDPKNWDTLTAIVEVLRETTPAARILDAGAELYSSFLPSLYTYGYRNLVGINLLFPRVIQRGPIRYEPGDITATRFANNYFHAVACLSVLEHGVNLSNFFREMARIIKPDGLLIVSTDYWETSVDTAGKEDFGAPIHVFSRQELEAAIENAHENGFELAVPAELDCHEKAVSWDYHNLQYTYVVLTFRRVAAPHAATTTKTGQPVELIS